jgi:hypothetical protein
MVVVVVVVVVVGGGGQSYDRELQHQRCKNLQRC